MLRVLRTRDYFGEISLIYGCHRTATVISSKYSTLAMLSADAYKELRLEFPEIKEYLKEGIYRYSDKVKRL
jgi:CRP-like cAMP-binding protein